MAFQCRKFAIPKEASAVVSETRVRGSQWCQEPLVYYLGLLFWGVFGLSMGKRREPTSGLEPLTCSLRVIHRALLGCAGGCKCRVFRRLSLLSFALCCTVLRPRWCQSGVKRGQKSRRPFCGVCPQDTPSRPFVGVRTVKARQALVRACSPTPQRLGRSWKFRRSRAKKAETSWSRTRSASGPQHQISTGKPY